MISVSTSSGTVGNPLVMNSLRSNTIATVAMRGCRAAGGTSPRASARARMASQVALPASAEPSSNAAPRRRPMARSVPLAARVRYGPYPKERRCAMRAKGIGYDTGFSFDGVHRRPFDHRVVRRELEIIRDDLHCTAVRLFGND